VYRNPHTGEELYSPGVVVGLALEGLSAACAARRAQAAAGLGRLALRGGYGPVEAVRVTIPALHRALTDEDATVREMARRALAIIWNDGTR
jgi:hypothetical protein